MAQKANLFKNKFPYISVIDEASDFKMGKTRPIIKSHADEKWAWPLARGAPQNLESPLIVLQRLKLATSNFVCSLGLPRAIIKSQRKTGRGFGLGKLPKILVFPCNISATAEASEFKFGMQLGYTQRKKWAWPWAREAP